VKGREAFSPEKNGELFKKASDFFHETLNIKVCRTYSEFEEYNPAFVGVCGMTMQAVYRHFCKLPLKTPSSI
jgi:hypothetical protein